MHDKRLERLQSAVVAGIKSGDYSSFDSLIHGGGLEVEENDGGPEDTTWIFARELAKSVAEKCGQNLGTQEGSSVLGDSRISEPVSEVAGKEPGADARELLAADERIIGGFDQGGGI